MAPPTTPTEPRARSLAHADARWTAQQAERPATRRPRRKRAGEPRQPDTAYTFFWKSRRAQVAAENPRLAAPLVSREVGRQWKALAAADRRVWDALAAQDTLRFRREMARYSPPPDEDEARRRASDSRRRPVLRTSMTRAGTAAATAATAATATARGRARGSALAPPRRPQTAYNLMYLSTRAEVLATFQVSHNECSALCGRLWRQMTDAEREPFRRMAGEDKRRYAAQLEEYQARVVAAAAGPGTGGGDNHGGGDGARESAATKRRDGQELAPRDAMGLWASMPESQQVLWKALGVDRARDWPGGPTGSVDKEGKEEEEQQQQQRRRQMEESARVVLAAREVRFSLDERVEDGGAASESESVGGDESAPLGDGRGRLWAPRALDLPAATAATGTASDGGGSEGGADGLSALLPADAFA